MDEITSKNDTLPTHTINNWKVKELLLVSSIIITLIWYLQFLWHRRKWYIYTYKIPGPFALPFIGSPWYFAGNPYDIITNIIYLFTNYPKIFKLWLGPQLFFGISDPKYCEILLQKFLEKDVLYEKFNTMTGNGLFNARLTRWKKTRKIISPTFNHNILNGFVEVFSDQSEVMVEQLKKYAGKGEFDVLHPVSNCTLDIICETAMGVKVNAQTTNTEFPTWVDRLLELMFLKACILVFRFDTIFNLLPVGREAKVLLKYFHGYTGKIVQERHRAYQLKMQAKKEGICLDNGPKRKAFLDYLIEISSEGDTRLDEQQMRDEVNTFIIAGSDTTATTFCFALTMLGLHKEFQENIYNEIIDVIGENNKLEAEHLPYLKYTERFIKETLRLFPVGIVIVRETDQDIALGDYILPFGVSVAIGILSIHTNQEYWPNPFNFNPDRFLPEEVAKRHPCTYLPFSFGPRNCIGLKFAMMELKTMIAVMLRKYKVFTHYKKVEDIELKANMVTRPKDGFKVYIEPR